MLKSNSMPISAQRRSSALCLSRGPGCRLEFVTHSVEGPLGQVPPCTHDRLDSQFDLTEGWVVSAVLQVRSGFLATHWFHEGTMVRILHLMLAVCAPFCCALGLRKLQLILRAALRRTEFGPSE